MFALIVSSWMRVDAVSIRPMMCGYDTRGKRGTSVSIVPDCGATSMQLGRRGGWGTHQSFQNLVKLRLLDLRQRRWVDQQSFSPSQRYIIFAVPNGFGFALLLAGALGVCRSGDVHPKATQCDRCQGVPAISEYICKIRLTPKGYLPSRVTGES